METDRNIQQQIEKALETSILLQGANIEVEVKNGEAILTGYANKFFKKGIAKKIAKEVDGVKKVVEEILIVLDDPDHVSDNEITAKISEKFKKNFGNAEKDVTIVVKDGYVWLEGRLKWKYQKNLAEECISDVVGIKGIDNNIYIPDALEPAIDEKDVFAAIYGDRSITSDITVEIMGHSVILKGSVESPDQKNLVTRLVRNVPGVKEIENFISVDWMC